jgi:hypothetical protein
MCINTGSESPFHRVGIEIDEVLLVWGAVSSVEMRDVGIKSSAHITWTYRDRGCPYRLIRFLKMAGGRVCLLVGLGTRRAASTPGLSW